MKISELVSEQTIGTTGSTTGTPGQVGQVSQTAPTTSATATPTTDPNVQKLAAMLTQNKIIDNENQVNDFMAAKTATDTGKPLTPQQQAVMARLGPAVLKNKTLDQNLDLLIKTMSAQKPGSSV
jgi:hypothetical protein